MKIKSLFSYSVILLFLLNIMSCNEVPEDLIGNWCNEQGQIDFNEDLSCLVIDSQGHETQGTYKILGEKVIIEMEDNETITYTFVIAGDMLILTDNPVNSSAFTKCDSTAPTTTTSHSGSSTTSTVQGGSVTTTTSTSSDGVNIDLSWVDIPGGSFKMGCSDGDTDCYRNEFPRHTVNVLAFQMTKHEITQGQFLNVMGWNQSYNLAGGDYPVEQKSWNDAKAFCEAVGGRLPSEAEWEYAARAGTTTRYPCGNEESCLSSIAWYDDNSEYTTHPVGQKEANFFGLHDMTGNVWEWIKDCYYDDYTGAPTDGSAWEADDCNLRVMRGGGFYHKEYDSASSDSTAEMRISYRDVVGAWNTSGGYGFRCARDK